MSASAFDRIARAIRIEDVQRFFLNDSIDASAPAWRVWEWANQYEGDEGLLPVVTDATTINRRIIGVLWFGEGSMQVFEAIDRSVRRALGEDEYFYWWDEEHGGEWPENGHHPIPQVQTILNSPIEAALDGIAEWVRLEDVFSSDSTLLSASMMLAQYPDRRYYVLDGSDLSGYVEFDDVFNHELRAALFSLTLQLEQSVLKASCNSPKEAWECLKPSRRRKAHRTLLHKLIRTKRVVVEHQLGDMSDDEVLACLREYYDIEDDSEELYEHKRVLDGLLGATEYCDKIRMASRMGLLGEDTSILNDAKGLRDRCAHPSGEGFIEPEEYLSIAPRLRKALALLG